MNKGILASQVSFTRGATPLEFMAHYQGYLIGSVKRIGRGKGAKWVVEDSLECSGTTREEAVVKYIVGECLVNVPGTDELVVCLTTFEGSLS
jgi:hypothetical protein